MYLQLGMLTQNVCGRLVQRNVTSLLITIVGPISKLVQAHIHICVYTLSFPSPSTPLKCIYFIFISMLSQAAMVLQQEQIPGLLTRPSHRVFNILQHHMVNAKSKESI